MTNDLNPALNPSLASKLAKAALGHIEREYPNVLVHALAGPDDLGTPRALHPIFFGSYDWHSCVHSHWLLARLLRLMPDLPEAPAIRTHFNQAFTTPKVAGELAYFARPTSAGFERPYGWAWLLMLAGELRQHAGADAHVWDLTLRPLADALVIRFEAFLPKADYPVRAGVHSNTAFALALAHDYARTVQNAGFADLIEAKAASWYGRDAGCQAWEPSGDDFLSPALIEAELMRRILPAPAFRDWFARFLRDAARGEPATLFRPARVSDRGDGKVAHLDGLNLSRAWCWRGIACAAGDDEALRGVAEAAAARHLAASLPHVTGDYMGEHWLASFALLALLA
ncbi:MAG: hypothetical protein JWO83_2176 [Caulobacteraceae bacterium]|nr:hypothetical protein [Caulobacteraceae bacterium]